MRTSRYRPPSHRRRRSRRLSNDTKRLFGLDPTLSSSNPVTSTDLTTWTPDTGATQTVTTTTADNIQTVNVTLSAGLLTSGQRFIRVQAVVP